MELYTNHAATKARIEEATKQAEKPLTFADLKRYIASHPSLIRIRDLWNRRRLPLEWEYETELEMNCLICDKARSAKAASPYSAGAYYTVYKAVIQSCTNPGLGNVVRVMFYGGFTLSHLYAVGYDKAFEGKKPLRTFIMTRPAWKEAEKRLGMWDSITAMHKAHELEKILEKSGECWVNQNNFYLD